MKSRIIKHLSDSGLGLERGTVALVSYNSLWAEAFDFLQTEIVQAVQSFRIDIEHVGSTAIVGCLAKPILDILIVFEPDSDFADETKGLEQIGFLAKGPYGIPGRHFFNFYNDNALIDYAHIHAFPHGHPDIAQQLIFRDRLRGSKDLTQQYSDLKQSLLQSGISRKDYPAAKTDFIMSIF